MLRILATVTLLIVAYINIIYRSQFNFLWICNLSAILCCSILMILPARLMHARSIAFTWFLRTMAVWMIAGSLVWLLDDVFNSRDFDPLSYITHALYLLTAGIVLVRLRLSKWLWIQCLLWFWLCQILARLLGDPSENINLAFAIWPGWEVFFAAYWQYWLFLSSMIAIVLFLLNFQWVLIIKIRNKDL